MSLSAPAQENNRPRVLVALAGVSLILAWTVIVGVINHNHQNKPQPVVPANLKVLQKDVRKAVQNALRAYKASGQMDPGMVEGMDNRMASGMSAWYPTETRVRISRPGGCTVWVQGQAVRFNAACRN